jgi:glycosyltransferase involved in cell wall biosynthesis
VHVVSGGGELAQLLKQHGVAAHTVSFSRSSVRNLVKAQFEWLRLARRMRPDVVHSHNVTGTIVTLPGQWVANYATVSTVHNEFYRSAPLMALSDLVVALSEHALQELPSRGFASQRLRLVENGPLGSRRHPTDRASDTSRVWQRPVIVTVAGMNERKGIRDLLEAFSTVVAEDGEAHLYLVGDGPDRTQFEQYAQKLGLETRVTFEGFHRDPHVWYDNADIFVLASRADPAPLVIPEARASGSAIIGTAVGGIPAMLDHGRAGVLVPPQSPDCLAKELLHLIKDSKYRAEQQRAAKANIDRFSVTRTAKDTLAVYQEARIQNHSVRGRARRGINGVRGCLCGTRA